MLKNIDKVSKLLVICLILFLMLAYVIYNTYAYSDKTDYSTTISDSLNKIENNYDLEINDSISYSRDEYIEIYKSNTFAFNKEYISYNNKFYIRDNDKFKETTINNDIKNRYFYDIDLIKSVVKYCKYSTYQNRNIRCNISGEDYNNELTTKYGINPLEIDNVYFAFYLVNDNITTINATYGNEKYSITINNINANNYSNITELIN